MLIVAEPPAFVTALLRTTQLAGFAFSSANYDESLTLCDQLLRQPEQLSVEQECQLRNMRGEIHYFRDELDEAIKDWSAVVDRKNVPVAELARALFNRGVAQGELGDTARELADYSRIIDHLPTAPTATTASIRRRTRISRRPFSLPARR